jgi:hypothetical protein
LSEEYDLTYQLLHFRIDIFLTCTTIGCLVVSNIVKIVLPEEIDCEDPWTRAYYLVDPFAMKQDFASFELIHHDLSFLLDGFFIPAYSDNQMDVGE